jgi:transcriptional regulator with XRE-family HTH domain
MSLREILARNIRHWRAHRDLSPEWLALRAGVSRGYMSDRERAEHSVSLDVVERVAKELGLPAATLLEAPTKGRSKI